jgi:hypothetical protein
VAWPDRAKPQTCVTSPAVAMTSDRNRFHRLRVVVAIVGDAGANDDGHQRSGTERLGCEAAGQGRFIGFAQGVVAGLRRRIVADCCHAHE